MRATEKALSEALEQRTDNLRRIICLIDSAGLGNLSNGVQLGQISWYAKMSDEVEIAKRALAELEDGK